MTDRKQARVEAALRGQKPTILTRLPEAFAAIGDVQWLPGYCVLLTDDPTITRLSDLPGHDASPTSRASTDSPAPSNTHADEPTASFVE